MEQLEQVQAWLEEIDEAEDTVSYLKGKIASKKEEMNTVFGVTTIKQAQTLYKKLTNDLTVLENEIETDIDILETHFDALENSNE
jgi:division protein CdvB (Snf7/Vps24/ESCRT-III family)